MPGRQRGRPRLYPKGGMGILRVRLPKKITQWLDRQGRPAFRSAGAEAGMIIMAVYNKSRRE